ncbi:glycosyltransferase [Streptomyces sp. YC537]|uniref:D-inositol 3-phosphate glycosyltransferase n=1 Tax=Streptomyces boluensis TaxID=1775135 RepID=A0A964UMP2_9ACTN|nr:glycosyltransferase [Streptomyces boluensis]
MTGDARLWCDRLVRGLEQHEFKVFALSRSAEQEQQGWIELPPQVHRVRTAPLWSAADEPGGAAADGPGAGGRRAYGRRQRRRFVEHFGELAAAMCAGTASDGAADVADRFANALYGLAELARDEGGLATALRSETAVRALERACRAPGALRAAHEARVPDLLAVAALLEQALRPLSLDWYEDEEGGLGSVDLCHAASGGCAALPGLLAKHFFGVPLLVTEYGVQLRAHYLGGAGEGAGAPARALLAAFHGRLAAEVYRQATLITPGNTHARRWQEKCGAERGKLRTVYPGMAAGRFAEVGEAGESGEYLADPGTLVWVGRIEPAKDLVGLLHAFAEVRKEEPKSRLRIVGAPALGEAAGAYLAHCRALAAQLFPDEAEGVHAVGDNPVSFEEIGGPDVPELADAYAAGSVVVLSSVVEGFPISLVEAMFCGRATVSTDTGAVVEVIGGTGLVVPPRNPRALADACVALLRDPARRERLGAAARARALELFTVEQNVAAFHSIYLEIVARCPVRREVLDEDGDPLPFAHPAEIHLAGQWPSGTAQGTAQGADDAGPGALKGARGGPSWAESGRSAEAVGAREAAAAVVAEAVARAEGVPESAPPKAPAPAGPDGSRTPTGAEADAPEVEIEVAVDVAELFGVAAQASPGGEPVGAGVAGREGEA